VSDLENLCDKTNLTIPENTPTNTTSSIIRNDLKKTTSLPDEQLVFKFDCILQERATYDELMGALEANSLNTQFSLQISKLDLLCLGKANIIKLLDKLEKNVRFFKIKFKWLLRKKNYLFNKLVYRRSPSAVQLDHGGKHQRHFTFAQSTH
jgi:hypothetical protein